MKRRFFILAVLSLILAPSAVYPQSIGGGYLGQSSFFPGLTLYQTLGAEKTTNGTFASDTSWTKGANWAIAGGVATHTAGSTATLYQDATEAAGEVYRVVFTVSGRTAGTITVSVGGKSGTARSTNTTFTEDLVAIDTGDVTFTPSTDFDGSLDDVSVKQITAFQTNFLTKINSSGALTSGIVQDDGTRVIIGNGYMGSPLHQIFAANVVVASTGDQGPFFVMSNSSAAVDNGGHITLGGYLTGTSTPYGFASIHGRQEVGDAATGYMILATGRSGVAGQVERQRISSLGWHTYTMHDNTATPVAATAGLKFWAHNKSMLDDGIVTLPTVTTNGYGVIAADTDVSDRTQFFVDSTGTVTLVNNAGSVVANADTDTNLCVGTAATQEPLQVKNRLGATKVVNILFWYD